MLVFIMQIMETWEMLFSFDSRVGDTLLSTPGHAGLIFQPKVKQPRNNINETEKTCELCWCLLISGPRTIHLLPCPATEFLLIMWLGNLKVYLIFDAVIHISHGRISFVFKEIMVSRSGGTREYVNFQVPPPPCPTTPSHPKPWGNGQKPNQVHLVNAHCIPPGRNSNLHCRLYFSPKKM